MSRLNTEGAAMTLAVCCTSHSPLLELIDPGPELTADVETAFATARDFVRDDDPEPVIVFAPDHHNGILHEPMPPFLRRAGSHVDRDHGSEAGPLDVPRRHRPGVRHVGVRRRGPMT
jgi:2,3-dihydroxyphenylpropionate 1,2-dioxygenase